MTGKIMILDSSGGIAAILPYNDAHVKSESAIPVIKEKWKKRYGKRYSEERIVIQPDHVETVIEKDQEEIVITQKSKRPEAVYSNPTFNS